MTRQMDVSGTLKKTRRICPFDSLVIHGHKQEVLFEDVHMARPRLDPLVAPLPLTAEETQQGTSLNIVS